MYLVDLLLVCSCVVLPEFHCDLPLYDISARTLEYKVFPVLYYPAVVLSQYEYV